MSASGSPPAHATLARPPSPRSSRRGTGRARRAAARRARRRSRACRRSGAPRRRARAGARCASRRGGRTARTPTSSARRSRGRPAPAAAPRSALLDLVARALVGEERGGIAPTSSSSKNARNSPWSVTSPITVHGSSHRSQTARTSSTLLRRDDRDHPLLRLGDHDLPRLEVGLAQRHAVEVHVDATPRAPSRRATTRGLRRRSPAARARGRARRARATPRSAPCRGTGRRSGPTAASRPSPRESCDASTDAPPIPSRPVSAP